MNKLQKIFGVSALALALSGCTDFNATDLFNFSRKKIEVTNKKEVTKEDELSLEGVILKVQPSTIAFRCEVNSSANHEFLYVMVNKNFDKPFIFIYPRSKAILEGRVKIRYKPLEKGSITSGELINKYVGSNCGAFDHFNIEGNGIIKEGEIEYK